MQIARALAIFIYFRYFQIDKVTALEVILEVFVK